MAKVNLFHKILLDEKYITEQQLMECLEETSKNPELKLGRVLLTKKYLTEPQLREIANRVKAEMAQAGDINIQEQQAQAASQSQMGKFIEEAAREKNGKVQKTIKEIVSETSRTDYKNLIFVCVCIMLLLGFGVYQFLQSQDTQPKAVPTPTPIVVADKPDPAREAAEQRQEIISEAIATRQAEIEKILSRQPAPAEVKEKPKATFENRQKDLLEDTCGRIDALEKKTDQSPLDKMDAETRRAETVKLEAELLQVAAGLEVLKNIAENKASAQIKGSKPDAPVVLTRKSFDQLLKLAELPEPTLACVALVCLEKVAVDMPDYGAEKLYNLLAASKNRDLRHGVLKCLIAWANKNNQRSVELVRFYMNGKISRDEAEEIGKLIFAANKAELIGVENIRETLALDRLFRPINFMLKQSDKQNTTDNTGMVAALQSLKDSLTQFLTDTPNRLRAKKEIFLHFESLSDCLKSTNEGVAEGAFDILLFCLTEQKDEVFRKVVDSFREIVEGERSSTMKIQAASELLALLRDKEIIDIVASRIAISKEQQPEVRVAFCDLLAKWAPNENTVAELTKNFTVETNPNVIETINLSLSRLLGDARITPNAKNIFETYSDAVRSAGPEKSLAALEFISSNLDKLADNNPDLKAEVINLAADRLASTDPRIFQTAFTALGNLCSEPNSLPDNARQNLLTRLNKTESEIEFNTILNFLTVNAPNAVDYQFLKNKLLWAMQEPRVRGDKGFVPHEPRWMMIDAIEAAMLANFQPSYIDDLRVMVMSSKAYPTAGIMYNTGGRRERVVRMIARFQDDQAVESLIQIFDSMQDKASAELRQVIAQAISQRSGENAVSHLAEMFKRDDGVFKSLERVPGETISRAIVKCLQENPSDSPVYKKCEGALVNRQDQVAQQYRAGKSNP